MKDFSCYVYYAIILAFSLFQFSTVAQEKNRLNTKVIDSFMLNKYIQKADSALTAQITYLENKNLNDSLHKYPYYLGRIELLKSNSTKASIKADAFLDHILSATNNQRTHYKSLLSLSNFYDEIGNNAKSLELTKSAYTAIQKVQDATPEEIGKVEYNVGATMLALGNIREAEKYFKRALQNFESYKSTDRGQLSDGYNAVGATMWMSTKLDSAKYYYTKALKTIETAKGNPLYNLYLATVIQSNLSLLEYSQGDLAEAVTIQNVVITNYEKVIQNYTDENVVSKAKRFQARAISNLAVFYNEQGDLKKANDILIFAHNKRKKFVEAGDPSFGASWIQIGQSQMSLREYDQAIESLTLGLDQLNRIEDDNPYWKAAGLHALAEAHSATNNPGLAAQYYSESEPLFKKALDNVYDIEFLNFLRNKSCFLADNGESEEAVAFATDAYEYVIKHGGDDNFSEFKQLLNLAEVNYRIGNYDKTLEWVQKADDFLNKRSTTADSIQIEFHKPQLILLKAQAEYKLNDQMDTIFLQQQLKSLDKATDILERRKTTLYKYEDINVLVSNYQSISSLAIQLNLKLFDITKNSKYLSQMMKLHESGIYNRIRSRLNLRNNIAFSDVPKNILEREIQLKNTMASSLEDSENMVAFFDSNSDWKHFLDSLKQQHPKYYKMRYATIEEPLNELQKNIPVNTTVVRYVYVDTVLYAFVADANDTQMFKLNSKGIEQNITELSENNLEFSKTAALLSKLYTQLWLPFETKMTNEHIIIIPDGVLFNLSFESLTPSKIIKPKDLATTSLLSKHIISYNYSLLLLNKNQQPNSFDNNFVAFAPEFNDAMKKSYKKTISDSLTLDHSYLTLLPQPFSISLAKKFSKEFNGQYFVNDMALKRSFTTHAKNHKIIYIGTHAESNNLSPELSRLVFAKSLDSLNAEDNSLYSYEIYDIDLESNLAILTACETGKPSYQAGEGMISLAHAFNYAGSESILTSLWKIDEQSSAKIIESFYEYLKKGWAKDKALQQAKLDYISTADGRTAHPQYWAGLVLIGDTTPIELSSSPNHILWILAGLALLGVIYFVRKKLYN
ncbi:CHAT domain-containing protein [Gelidibacter maritimus]|uniref:CHAT domain-containing protein n=1 Tax=Gelidibacter maritimus TaxID=2761487 RepID=A0A7W2M3J9_9FLAO|nr:CHAT domain-containing protein [Gelidibacter maritimus]MBA6152059.1 CHAT domain-containing protein [Gelidibacter maritimus]